MGILLDHLTRAQLSHAVGRQVKVQGMRRFFAGAAAAVGWVGAFLSILAGSAVVDGVARAGSVDAAKYVVIVLAPLVYAVCVAPFAFLPVALLDDEQSDDRVFHTALRVAGQLSTPRRLWIGACWALVVAGSMLTVAAVEPFGFLVAGALWCVAMPIVVAQHVAAYVEVSRRVAPDGDSSLCAVQVGEGRGAVDDAPLLFPPFVRGLLGSAAVASAVFVIVLSFSALTPLPLQRALESEHEWSSEPLRIQGTSLTVRVVGDGVQIAADDGGGVGHVAGAHIDAVAFTRLGDDRVRVFGRGPYGQWATVITNEGARVDDGFVARLSSRMNWIVGLCVVLALLALLWAGRLLTRVASGRALLDLARTDDHAGEGETRVLEGRLRLDGALVRRGRRWVPSGSARVEGASLRVLIPPGGVRTQGDETELVDGEVVSLVGRFPKLTSAALREHLAPWPADALLVPGGRRAAASALVTRAAPPIAMAFALVDVALVIGSIVLALRT